MKSEIYTKYLETPFEKFIKSPEFKNSRRVNLLLGVTGQGKSMFQDVDLRRIANENGYCVLFRLSPDTAIRDDGVFVSNNDGWYNVTHYDSRHYDKSEIGNFNEKMDLVSQVRMMSSVAGKMSCCFSLTWSTFTNNRDAILRELINSKLITNTMIVVEEAHQMIGTGVSKEDGIDGTDDNGNPVFKSTLAFQEVFGCHTPSFEGSHWKSLTMFLESGAKAVGLSATITRHQRGQLTSYPEFNDRFYTINDLPSLVEMLPHQAWWSSFNPFVLENDKANKEVCPNAMFELFKNDERRLNRVNKLTEIKNATNCSAIDPKSTHIIFTGNDSLDENWMSDTSIRFRNMFNPFAVQKIADGTVEPEDGAFVVLNCDRKVQLDANENVVRTYATDQEAFDDLEDPNSKATFLFLKNKGRSGIDIHNIGAVTILRCRTCTEIRTEIPIQVFGRGIRINPGLGKNFFRSNCSYDVRKFMELAPKEFGLSPRIVADVLLLSNCVDYTYPTSSKSSIKDIWGESVEMYVNDYMNSHDDGRKLIESLVDEVCLCPTCNQPLPDGLVLPESVKNSAPRYVLN
jgi:hypothetical protein